jgi:hypothetical protein
MGGVVSMCSSMYTQYGRYSQKTVSQVGNYFKWLNSGPSVLVGRDLGLALDCAIVLLGVLQNRVLNLDFGGPQDSAREKKRWIT